MAKNHATILLSNKSRYGIVEYECPGNNGRLTRGTDIAIHTKGATYDIQIRVKNAKNKQIKYVKFHTECADHWAVDDYGAVLESMGHESNVARPRQRKNRIGETHKWQEDKEAFYAEEDRKQAEKQKTEEEARKKAEEETRKKAEEAARKKAEEEARKKSQEAARKKAEEEARKKAQEAARKKAEEEARKKAQEAARKKAEEEARKNAQEAARKKAEEEARKKAQETARKKAEEEARKKVQEAARKKSEEEAREKIEIEAREKAAEDRKIKREEARHAKDLVERDAIATDIDNKMENKRLNNELNAEKTINFEKSATSASAVKEKHVEKQQEEAAINDLCDVFVNSAKCQKESYQALQQAFAKLKAGSMHSSRIIDAMKKFLAKITTLTDENLTTIILENLNCLSRSLINVLMGKLLGCSLDDVKSKTHIFDLMVAVFEQQCSENSIWHKIKIACKEGHEFHKHCDSTKTSECLEYFEKYTLLVNQVRKVQQTSPDEMIDLLISIQDKQDNYPENCVLASLNAFADLCNEKKFPEKAYNFTLKLAEEKHAMLPSSILDLVAQNISTNGMNTVQEAIVKTCFEKGQMSKGMLEYLDKVCNKHIQSSFKEAELLKWLGEYVQNFNQLPNGFLSYVINLINNYMFGSITEFQYCICILQFYLTHLNLSIVREELQKDGSNMFLKFLINSKNDDVMKVSLLKLMTKLLLMDRIEMNSELSKTLVNIISDVKFINEDLSQITFEFLQVQISKNVQLFEWITVPASVLTVNNPKLKKIYILLIAERLQSTNIPYEIPQEILRSIAELVKNGNFDEDIIVACLTTIAIELSKEKSREIIKEIVKPECLRDILKTFGNKSIKEEAIFAISEFSMACSEYRMTCFPILKDVFFKWPTVQAHGYASRALNKIITELPKSEADHLLKDFINQEMENEALLNPIMQKDTKTVFLAWLGHFQGDIPEEDFKQLCAYSSKSSDKTIPKILFGLALQNDLEPQNKIIEQLHQLSVDPANIMPMETITGIKHFIEQEAKTLNSKVLLAEILLDYCKRSVDPSTEIIEALNALNTTEDTKLCEMYVTSTSYYISNAHLPQTAMKHLWDKVVDASASIAIRKVAARTILLAILQHDGSLEEKYLSKLVCLLNIAELIASALFIMCSVSLYQLAPIASQLTEKLLTIQQPDMKTTPDKSEATLKEQDLCFRLAQLVSKKMKDNEDIFFFSELNSNYSDGDLLNCNWLSEWLKLYPADEQQLFRLVNSMANKMTRSTTGTSDGNQLKLQVLISRAENARMKMQYAKAISWLDKSSQNAKKYAIAQFDQEIMLQKAIVHQLFGSHKAAIKGFKKLQSTAEGLNSFWLTYHISKSLLASGRYDAALTVIKSLPTKVENEFLNKITLCENASKLSKILSEKTGSKSIAQAQIKFLLTKTQNNPTQQVCTLVSFLLERDKYYDLSVLATKPETEWELEFLKSEIYGRLKDGADRYPVVVNSYNKLKVFLRTNCDVAEPDMWRTKLHGLLDCIVKCQRDARILSANTCTETFLLLRLKDDSGTKILSSCKNDNELIDALRLEWLKGECMSNSIQPPPQQELEEFWEAIKKGPIQNKNTAFLEEFLQMALKSNTFNQIVSFLKFCQSHDVNEQEMNSMVSQAVLEIQSNEMDLKEKQKQIERKIISDKLQEVFENEDKLDKLQFHLLGLFDRNVATSEDIMKLLLNVDEDKKEVTAQELLETLYVFTTYQLENKEDSDSAKEVLSVLWNSKDTKEWKSKLSDAYNSSFESVDTTDKSIDQLVVEFLEGNIKDCSKQVNDSINKLGSLVTEIKNYKISTYNPTTIKGLSSEKIEDWKQKDLQLWANQIKADTKKVKSNEYMAELLAIMQKAMQITMGYPLRDVGLMSVITLLLSTEESKSKEKGCLAKIATGEGKSAIVATLATIKVLQGQKVDIVTSSPILADRDANEWKEFYANFGISVEGNGGQQLHRGEPKSCYTKDVVYGDASMYEGDVLRHEFSLLKTRGERSYEVVIVDEVDSMFLDGSNHSTRLIESMPEMEYLENVFAKIWYEIQASGCLEINDKIYIIEESKGYATKEGLFAAIASVLQDKYKLAYNFNDEFSLTRNTQIFAEAMLGKQLNDQKYRHHIENILKNKKILAQLEKELQMMLPPKDASENNVPENFIKNQWKLDTEGDVRRILEQFLDVSICIYDVKDEKMEFSQLFHSYEYIRNTATQREEVHFLIDDKRLYYLKPVESMHKGIAERTAINVAKMVKPSDLQGPKEEKGQDDAIIIPSHLYGMFLTKVDEWIQSALQAHFLLEEDRDYIIKDNDGVKSIVPVDFQNTGVTEESCMWGEGLHQFLQLKHKFRITPEYLATNYLSNLTFFKKYKTIFGLTGTLGDVSECNLLMKLYQVTTLNVPTFRTKQKIELAPIVVLENNEWLSNILYSTTLEVRKKRAVLIICKTIEDVGIVHTYLEEHVKKGEANFKIYSRSDTTEAEIVKEALGPGTVIVATNLAGRGTNIKLVDDVVNNGGLHVIISFLPTNLRVEEQAAGRAARCGEPGTSMLIINAMTDMLGYTDESSFQIDKIKEFREENERARVSDIEKRLVKQIEKEEELFTNFCKLRDRLKSAPNSISQNILNGIAERWAVQLETEKTKGKIDWDSISNKFNVFFADLECKQKDENAIMNPAYYILEGNELCFKNSYGEAIAKFEKATMLDAYFVHNAYYNMAYAMINNDQSKNQDKAAAKVHLENAYKLIVEIAIPSLMQLHSMIETKALEFEPSSNENNIPSMQKSEEDSDFTKQITGKINFYYLQLKSIQDAMQQLDSINGIAVAKFSSSVVNYYDENKQKCNDADLTEMYNGGFVSFISVEKKPVPWYEFAVVFILGAIQLVAGIALCCCGLPNIGAGLICDGIGDFVMGVKAVISGELDLAGYLKSKAMNFAVNLLCAGVGAAFKAVATLSKTVQHAVSAVKGVIAHVKTAAGHVISAVKSSAKSIMSKATSGIQRVTNKFIESSFGKICKKAYDWTEHIATRMYNSVKDSELMKTFKQYRDEGLEKARITKSQFRQNSKELFHIDKLSPENQKLLKKIGKEIFEDAMTEGILPYAEDALMKPIEGKIKESIKSTVHANLQSELSSGTDLYKNLTEVLTSSTEENVDAEINAIMYVFFVGYESELGNKCNTIAEKIAGKLQKATDEYITSKGGRGIGKVIENVGVELIISTTINAETIKELNTMSSDLITYLTSVVKEMKKNNSTSANNTQPSKTSEKEAQDIINEYIECWSEEIASEVTQFVMNEYVRPTTEISLEQMYSKVLKPQKRISQNMTNKSASLEEASLGSGKDTANPAKPASFKDTISVLDLDTDVVNAEKNVESGVNAFTNMIQYVRSNKDPMQSSQDMQMTAYSSMLQKPIQVFQETEGGEFRYENSFCENVDTSKVAPIRLLQLPMASGAEACKFVPMVKNEDGVLEVLELTDLPDECSLATSLMIADGTQRINCKSIEEFHRNMIAAINGDVPRFPNSVKDDFSKLDNTAKDIILCNTA